MNEILLGFDYRELGLSYPSQWSIDRRDLYLLKDDIHQPYSVDSDVWQAFKLSSTEPPNHHNLWDDLASIDKALEHLPAEQTGCKIAITKMTANGEKPPVAFNMLSPSNNLLGYDIADEFLLSGLSNCGYEKSEKSHLQHLFKPLLNEYHLFNNIHDAFAFRYIADLRVPDHAPFFVYGLYALP